MTESLLVHGRMSGSVKFYNFFFLPFWSFKLQMLYDNSSIFVVFALNFCVTGTGRLLLGIEHMIVGGVVLF